MVIILSLVEAVTRSQIRTYVLCGISVIITRSFKVRVEATTLPAGHPPHVAHGGGEVLNLLPITDTGTISDIGPSLSTGTSFQRNNVPMEVAATDPPVPGIRSSLRLHPPGEIIAMALGRITTSTS